MLGSDPGQLRVATTALAVRHSNHSARSHPSHPVDEISKLDTLAFIKLLVYLYTINGDDPIAVAPR